MDVKMINPFIEAFSQVMPQLGFQNVTRGKLSLKDQFVDSKGVTVLIGMTQQVRGNIAYNMNEQTACKFASVLMMGTPVAQLDAMAQSALGEMVNMLTANAAIQFSMQNLSVDISTPSLVVGESFKAKVSEHQFIVVELMIDSELIELNIGVEKGA